MKYELKLRTNYHGYSTGAHRLTYPAPLRLVGFNKALLGETNG